MLDTNEIAKLCFVTNYVIYYWEKKGLIPQAKRINGAHHRRWTAAQAKEIVKFSDARYGTKR